MTNPVQAVVDTGAAFTAFPSALLVDLGLDWDRLELRERIDGVGGVGEWRGTTLDLILGGMLPDPRIVLSKAKVFFSKGALAFPALIGQDDALYRLQFELCNREVVRRGGRQLPNFRLIGAT